MTNSWTDGWAASEIAAAQDFERALRGHRAFPTSSRLRSFPRGLPEMTEDYGESRIGDEDRVQVQNVATRPSTRLFPFNTICMIRTPTTIATSATSRRTSSASR